MKSLLVATLSLLLQQASTQTTLISPTGDGGFENGTTFAANGWSSDNGSGITNTWQLGTVPTGFTNRSAFVSADAGTTWGYTNTSASVVHFWRDVTFPAGQSAINLSFNWANLGESNYDELMVSFAPTSYTPVATSTSLGTGILPAPVVTFARLVNSSTAQSYSVAIPASLVGNCTAPVTLRIIFTWKNDTSGGTAPPAGIDNISLVCSTPAAPMSGTYTVGTGGNYATLNAATADVNSRGVSGPVVLELLAGYTSGTETFPINFGQNLSCSNAPSSSNTVTVRPASDAPLLSIVGANAGPAIDFNGGIWWRLDGRPGGVGTTKGLVVSNTSTTGQAIRFINESSNNAVRYCDVKGVNTSTASGVILFSTTTGTNGNDNNLIDNCDVHDGATTPANCIYSVGTSTTQTHYNSGNTVSNCNIYNFYLSTSICYGITLSTASTEWTVTGNSFYQTVSRSLASTYAAINLASTLTNGFVITNNYIGGSAPLCGGAPMTLTNAGNLRGINATVGPGTTLVQGNTIQNISFTSTNVSGFSAGLALGQGNFNCNNNTIGSLTANNNIVVSLSGSVATFSGIIFGGTSPTNTSTISNNSIGGISLTVTGTPATPPGLRGISIQGTVAGHNYIVTGNTVGSTTLANSMTADGNLSGAIIGIVSFSNALGQQINNNTVSNLTASNAGTSNLMWGIVAQGTSSIGSYTVTGNTVQVLTSGSSAAGSGSTASILAMQISPNLSTLGTNIVRQNVIHTLLNNNPTAAASVTGLVISLPAVTSNTVERNFVHSLNMASTALTGIATGIQVTGGVNDVQNNMVRLGVDAAGADITNGYSFYGIREAGGASNINNNSVYVGGAGVSGGTSNTFAFTSAITAGTRNYINNILVNTRSNGAGTGKHYAIALGGTAPNPAGASSNYNDLSVTGTGGFVGLYNGVDQAAIANWRTATGLDFQSISADPMYLTPNGNAATVNLHINAAIPTSIESAGQSIASITNDYDGETRATLTPTDMGADAGNFLLLDVSGPGIGYTPLVSACGTGDITLGNVNITDGTGIPLTGTLIPRIYYRKNSGTWFSRPGSLTSGGATNSVWSFTIQVADMGGIAAADVVGYYVIAQDNLSNIGSNASGAVATDVNNVTTHPVTTNTVTVLNALSGTYTVGVGGNYSTLTAAIADYNVKCIGGPIVFSLTDATYTAETFPITINANAAANSVNTLTIKPATDVNATISGVSATGLIVLNGADWVRINGSNGAGVNTICPPSTATRNLTLTNTGTSTTSAVVWLQNVVSTGNGATNNSITNCSISGGGPLTTLCGIGSGSPTISTTSLGTNNSNNAFVNNSISNAQYGIISQGNSAFGKNTGNVYNQNQLNTAAPANLANGGIFVTFEDNVTISGNNISGMSRTSSPDVCGILVGFTNSGLSSSTFAGNECTNVTITNNVIGSVVNSGSFSAGGIALASAASGTSLIANNMISGVAANGTSTDFGGGIILGGGVGTTINVFHNTVSMQGTITGTSSASSVSLALAYTNSTPPTNLNIKNNVLSNTQVGNTSATLRFMAIGVGYGSTQGNYAGLTSDNNDLYCAGAGPGTYQVGITGALSASGIVRTTLANWRTETGRDVNSFNVVPSFVSGTDLHLATTSNQCLDGGGTPTSITTDIDCAARNASIPDVGADEFTNPNLTLTIAETSGVANDGTICEGSPLTITANGGGTFLWSNGDTSAAISPAPSTTTTYTVTVTNGTCTDVMTTTITVLPVPELSTILTQPLTCVTTDGAINLTVFPAGTYTIDWADLAGNNDPEDRAALLVGTYNVTVTNTATGCTSSLMINLAGPGGCDVCPTIPNVSVVPSPVCQGVNFTVASSNLTSMGNTYGIIFKYSTTSLANPYTGGTVLATVPNANLTNIGTVASEIAALAATGNYFIYSVLTPTPLDPTCRPFAWTSLTVNPLPTPATSVAETSGVTNNDGNICVGASATITAMGGTAYSWNTGATTAAITVAPAGTTTYTVTVTNSSGCTGVVTRTITVNPLPTAYALVGGGGYCVGSIGVPVGLTNSQVGVSYQLQVNGINVGAAVAGNGAFITFGTITTIGTATVIATNTTTGCAASMTGPLTIYSFSCTVTISDPCVCKNNATNLTNGQFDETIKVNAPSNQVWTVVLSNGLFSAASLAPPTAPTPIANGTLLTNLGGNMFELKGIHVDAQGYNVTVTNNAGTVLTIGNSCSYPNPSITTDLTGEYCINSDAITLVGNPGDNNIASQQFTINGVPATQFTPSQGVGQYVIVYTVDGGVPKAFGPTDPGCTQKVSTTVHVVETPSLLNCNDVVYVSIDETCTGEIRPDDVLEGTYGCYDDYTVEIDRTLPMGNGPWTSALIDATDIGKTYQVRVTHKVSNNKCWGSVTIEDKLAPVVVCKDIRLVCPVTTYDPTYLKNVLNISTANPIITDCSNVTSGYVDTWFDLPCGGSINGIQDLSAYVQRKWTATDQWGNSTTCLQYLYFERRHAYDVQFPAEYTISCSANVDTDPSVTGAPYLSAFGLKWPINPGAGFCELQSAYVDQILPVCDGTYKILRTWTVLDWCLPTSPIPPYTNPLYYIQLIKVVDEAGPAFTCPANLTVSIDPFGCCATVDLPNRVIEDGCSRVNNISGSITTFDPYTGAQTGLYNIGGSLTDFAGNNWWDRDTLGQWGASPCLPLGTQTVVYRAQDDCSNVTTCSFKLTIADYVPPVASCDQTTTVAIGLDDPFDCYTPADGCDGAGVTFVNAKNFDDGSYDQCGTMKFTVRRMAPYTDCIANLSKNGCFPSGASEYDVATAEADSIKFYCCEVGTTQTIILRVYQTDVNGNIVNGPDGSPIFNECMVQVEVQDKNKPACIPPVNVTVSCEQFDPSLWLYGKAKIQDNCCLDITKEYQGQCGLTHAVNYAQFDTLCNKGTITRTFRAFDCHGNSSQCTQRVVVTYEQDYFVKFPNDVIVSTCDGTGVYGEPSFYGEDCELLGVSYEDQIFTVVPDACFKIERNWKIINWCTYNPNQAPLCVNVPNPTPNAIANHPTNLPGPIVSPIQTVGDPWKSTIVKINATDAAATNYASFYDANANCYTYKQIIKIIDTQDPTVDCPASPVTICDLTSNDAQLWNASYWWDNGNQSHDLCEAPSDICITGTDACSGSNINIEYQLFLDLDGDGTMETVVNSTQLGSQPGGLGWNNVLFGNTSGAGTSRQFDGRPVPTNQKWGFAIQESVTGVNKTACVKFNTFQAQNSYVTPQLPYGTHKIKWFVTDGCGNETICEYSIVIKDCKAPTVVCLNGLSVNIMPTAMIQMWATDFLQYAEDNCTQTQFLKYAIRKCGQGTGFPVDGQGNPITNVTFNCSELGTQCVELWSIDLAGNADYCETYVIVQDNAGNCGVGNTVNVSGALKTEGNETIEEGIVTLDATLNAAPPVTMFDMTDNNGTYAFNIALGSTVTVSPVKDDNPLNGVTTYDLVLISKHILGIQPLGSPYKMIAADANKSNSITTFDIVELRKLVLGINQELPNNTSWRFVDKAHVFANPANPFQNTIPETISFVDIMGNWMDQNFVGVKIGDVNNTAVANSLMVSDDRSVGTLLFDVNDRDVKAGETFEVTFTAAEKTQGYQMTLNLNGLAVSEIVGSDHVTANNFGVFADALTVSIDGSDAFTVKFRAAKAGKLSEMMSVSSRITKSEAYSLAEGRMDVALRFDGKTIAGVGFELYQNQPNPFVNKTFVGFHLPSAAAATLKVYDETGRVVFTQKGDFAKGYNAISLDRALLNTTGVLYYTLETATDAATKKMIQAK